MSKDSSSELPNWVCQPDEGYGHLTTYSQDGIGGCEKHPIAGGCSIPQADLKALIQSDRQELLKRIEGELPKKKQFNSNPINVLDTKQISIDGYNQALLEVQAIINAIKAEI